MAKVKEKPVRLNEAITAPQVRVVGVDGKQLGILPIREALRLAEEAGLDLVEIAPQAQPPVCRIMDYGKYLFEKSKKLQAARKKQKQVQVKEIKMRPGTDEADYRIKVRNMRRFLEDGDRVKVSLRFRGREITHPELGRRLLERVEQDLADIAQVEQYPKMEGRQMVMLLVPKKR